MTAPRHRHVGPVCAVVVAALLLPLPGCGDGDESVEDLYPGELTTYAISSVFIAHDEHEPGASLPIALEALRELRSGVPIADVARRRSDDRVAAENGGFLGFMRPEGENPMTGAIQVLPIGQAGGPLATQKGFHILYRHTHAEGREIERRLVVPVNGFFVNWKENPDGGELSAIQAQRRAEEAWQKVKDGSLTLLEAARQYASRPPIGDRIHLMNAGPVGRDAPFHDALQELSPGELAPLLPLRGSFAIVQRGRYLRSIVRHIMIMHNEGTPHAAELTRSRSEAEAFAKKVLAEARSGDFDWYELVEMRTDEGGMVRMGGTIGSVTNGRVHPALEKVLLETPPGEVASQLAESPDGFHILWRVD